MRWNEFKLWRRGEKRGGGGGGVTGGDDLFLVNVFLGRVFLGRSVRFSSPPRGNGTRMEL